jgi:tol-pal system protein YbgF
MVLQTRSNAWPLAQRWWAGLFLVGLVQTSHAAGLFEDEDARRAILDLRGQITQALAVIKQQGEQIQQLQRNQLAVANELEGIRVDNARLRGDNEKLLRKVAEVEQKIKASSQEVDERVRKLEPGIETVDGKRFKVDADERRAYEDAMSGLRAGDYDKATTDLGNFLKRYPTSGYADSVRYWLASAQYGRRDYRSATTTFRAFLTSAEADHPRAPEAMLALANCYVETKDSKTAKRLLEELIKKYPEAEASIAARERLAVLK